MNRPTPGRALRVLALTLMALAAAGSLTACGGAESRKARALSRGDEYLSAGRLDKARVEFRNALQIAPNDALSRYKNGVVQERLGNAREAYGFYQGALAIDPELTVARTDLARVELFGGSPERALETVKAGLEKHPDDAGLLTIRAAARSQLKDQAGALEDAERALRLDPNNENAISLLAGLYSAAGRAGEGQALLERAVGAIPKSTDLKLALAQLYTERKEYPKAESLLRDIVRLQPQDPAHRIRLAQFLAHANEPDAAEKTLREAEVAIPKDRSLTIALLDFLGVRHGRAAEEAEFRRMIEAAPEDTELRFAFAKFFEQGNEPPKSAEVLSAVIKSAGTSPSGLTARSRLAMLKIGQNDAAGAERLVDEVLKASPRDQDALILRGNLLLAKGDAKGAIDDLRSVLRDQPNSPGVMRVLARAHVRNGEPALAEETLRRAVDVAPTDTGARLDLGLLLTASGKLDAGKQVLAQLVKDQPADLAAQDALFRASIGTRDATTARAALAALSAGHPDSSRVHIYEGQLAELDGRPDAAIVAYERALAAQRDAAEPLESITRILVSQKRTAQAIKRLDDAAAASPTEALPLALKGRVLLGDKRFADANAALVAAEQRRPAWWVPYRAQAEVALRQNDSAGAVKILEKAVGSVDEPRALAGMLAELYQKAGQFDAAIAQYDRILAKNPNDLVAANNLAMLLISGHPDQARISRAVGLTERLGASESPQFLDTFGWVRLKKGEAQVGLAALEKAAATASDSAVIRYHLGVAQLAAGQASAGRESLKRSLGNGASFDGSDEARAALAQASAGS